MKPETNKRTKLLEETLFLVPMEINKSGSTGELTEQLSVIYENSNYILGVTKALSKRRSDPLNGDSFSRVNDFFCSLQSIYQDRIELIESILHTKEGE